METAANNNDNGGGGGVRKSSHPLPWLNLMVTEPFYLFHFLTFFSYVAVRSSASQNLPPDFSRHLLHREAQAFLTFSVLAAIKMVKQETWEAFIADALLYAKGLLCAVALIVDKHLALCYLLGFLVIFILTQQPPYDGLGDASHLTPLQLESKLTEGNTSKFWLVEFRSVCSACIRTSRIFPDLSTVYSNRNLSFGIVDLGHFPNAAEKFGIALNDPLPIYILFENNAEVARLPYINSESKASMPIIRKNLLCQHFELDRRLIEHISRK
ncbi:thioredoxin-related transmembrane protein 2 isoform X1 [Iris pallida]|uniref:Thioredoxin-related transmembrane protein 2 isoform X1 n=1 Tax=Iris pallida TaxID=29817 RepID=A0AAX6E793_IRIPA|nr:thioredoxin-related transmembrane protein 2 isoform X1 [Iris pallida]